MWYLRRVPAWLAGLAVLGAMGHSVYNNLWGARLWFGQAQFEGAFPRAVLSAVLDLRKRGESPKSVGDAVQESCPTGNILLHVKPLEEAEAREKYYQLAYTIYPRRAYVCDPNRVIVPWPAEDFSPTADWERQHDIQWLVVMSPIQGGISYQYRKITLPAQQGKAAGDTPRGEGRP